ncbi:MAG TPA: ABC transporter substrate-binding protein [Syntrophaceticus sp.]|nr:ABC transporter substrate-binding protein [Syntrophaceticus sp.]
MKKAVVVLLTLCLLFTLVGCDKGVVDDGKKTQSPDVSGDPSTPPEEVTFDGVIKVGAVGPLTGASAESGIAAKQGQELAVAEWNAKGGIEIDGKRYEIKLFYEDSEGKPEVAVAASEKLLGVDKVDVIFSETLISSCILAVMDLAPKYPDVVFSTIEGVSTAIPEKFASDPDKYSNFFKACWSSDTYGKIVAQSVMYLRDKGLTPQEKTVAFVLEDTDYGRSNAAAAEKLFAADGWETVAYEVSPQGTTDFYSQIFKLQGLNPAIVVSCFVPAASGIAYTKQVAEIGVDWTDIAIVYPSKAGYLEGAGSTCAGLFWTPLTVDFNSPELLEFADKIRDAFDVSITICQTSGYDVTNMMFEAIERAGTWKATEGLSESYAATEYVGLRGRYVFDENHCAIAGEGYMNMGLGQIQEDAVTSYIVWPESMQQAQPYKRK